MRLFRHAYHYLLGLLFIAIFPSCQEGENFENITQLDDHFFLRNNGADMPVAVQGNFEDKILVVFLQGGPADGAQFLSYSRVFNQLEEHYAMAYWDQRATGSASGTFPTESLTRAQYVDDLEKLITLVQHRYGDDTNIFLMGISWGGMLGSAYLVKDNNQQNIRGWIEINGAHDYPMILETGPNKMMEVADEQIAQGNSTNDWQAIRDFAVGFNAEDRRVENYAEYVQEAIKAEELLYGDDVIELSTDLENTGKLAFASSYHPLSSFFKNLLNSPNHHVSVDVANDTTVNAQLGRVTTPTLFLWGKYDLRVPQALAEDAYQRLGTQEVDKELVILERSTHPLPVNEPNRFYEEVVRFVNRHR
ncbi:alpha/beta fold hydrolase [Tunicatimonas pelagia]|uniref:alpha/beta fold hydrolase n=1 Tax=Tunicatimonas pelagia TaxID=931531 RepID=UPI002665B1B6|nr:alpha/beta hydrolase [Tunicatimonas pelagia]WKN42061.1 alpha/beta hydrolase [Tunicatimonas pelagia]